MALLGYSRYNAAPDPNYTYISKYEYGFGIGYSYGIQMGFTYYIVPQARASILTPGHEVCESKGTNDTHYGSTRIRRYYLLVFP